MNDQKKSGSISEDKILNEISSELECQLPKKKKYTNDFRH